eukprot:5582367-Prymnesium_polylepis.1
MFLSTRDGGRGKFVREGASFGGRSGLYSVETSIKPCETYDTGRSEWGASAGRVTTLTHGNSSSLDQLSLRRTIDYLLDLSSSRTSCQRHRRTA